MADEKGKGKSPEEEINQYLDILTKDPTSRVFARLAEAYRKNGQVDYAISICRDGLQNHPGYTAGQVVLARALFDGGKSTEARGEISQVVRSAPDNLTAQKLLAQIEVRLKDRAAAEKAYRMVQLLDPTDAEAQNFLSGESDGRERPPSLPAYESPPIETVPAAADVTAVAAAEAGVPAGLTFDGDLQVTAGGAEAVPEPPVEAEAVPEPAIEAAPSVSTEPVFDLGEMEAEAAKEAEEAVKEGAAPEPAVEESPFEVFTRAPRYASSPPAAVEEKADPFPEIELPGEGDLEVEPMTEEFPGRGQAPAVAAEVAASLVEEAPPTVGNAELPAAPADDFEVFGGGEERDEGRVPEPSAEGIFNTETLANLYISQGFYGKAADVYRQMLSDRPDDSNLRQKLEEVLSLEKMQTPSVEEVPVSGGGETTPEARVGTENPVIKDLQRLLAKFKERPR